YQIVEEAKGEKAKADDKVQIAFTSRIVDGEILVGEQNADTISVLIGKTEIPSGVNEAVQLLSEGEKGKFILPTHLAYGLTGDNDKVPPNAALIYNIHLLKIDRTTDKQNEKRNEQGN
ncbi:MAG: FKBP-type peptidyl-prolyl cis-trans isomerase, partial [Bacteroidia bacterium]|nr:FKBP-type peptidyl-prolyl cis-trans isomerase [Bacteroidia bacterium]